MVDRSCLAHARLTYRLFAGLGAQVGAFAVLVPGLADSRGLGPAALGAALGLMSAAAIFTLVGAGRIADRAGTRPLSLLGTGGFALAFALLAGLRAPVMVWPSLVVYGVASGLLDLGANVTGAQVERLHGMRGMVRFHAGFSAAACALALLVSAVLALGATVHAAYASMAVLFALLSVTLTRARFPVDGGEAATPGTRVPARLLARTPGVGVAIVLCAVCFFGDGAIESFAALVLRDGLGAGVLLAGVGVAAFHGASLAGRLALAELPASHALALGGAGAATGMTLVVLAPAPGFAAAGLLIVGFALAPVVPTTLSLAAHAAPPGSGGAAVSLVTSVGYSAFLVGPPLVGALAEVTSLRAALVPVIASTLTLALLGALSPSVRRPSSA